MLTWTVISCCVAVCVFSECCQLGLALFRCVEGVFLRRSTLALWAYVCAQQFLCVQQELGKLWYRLLGKARSLALHRHNRGIKPMKCLGSLQCVVWCVACFITANGGTQALFKAFHRAFIPQFCFNGNSNLYVISSG